MALNGVSKELDLTQKKSKGRALVGGRKEWGWGARLWLRAFSTMGSELGWPSCFIYANRGGPLWGTRRDKCTPFGHVHSICD